ncbi:hypothetical protein PENTCL1PPCAC_17074, partial [Pristionchus entomophagus]
PPPPPSKITTTRLQKLTCHFHSFDMKLALLLLGTLSVADAVFFAKSMQKREKEDFRPKLPFFANCTKEDIRAFFSITKNKTLQKKEVEERVREWAEARGNQTLDLYTNYINDLEFKKEAAFKILKLVTVELPEMLQKFHEARENMTMTGEEEEKRMLHIIDSYSLATRQAFIHLIGIYYPKGVSDNKRKPFIPSPRKNGENRNKGPYGQKVKIPIEEEAL